MPLGRVREPFSHPDWLFEVKWDGFCSLVRIDSGVRTLMSRNGNQFKSLLS
jgi:bifunctional non-homologous end joining protein LigD